MDYQNLFIQAWNLIWKNKFLIFLGMLVILGGVGWGGGSNQSYASWDGHPDIQNPPRRERSTNIPEFLRAGRNKRGRLSALL